MNKNKIKVVLFDLGGVVLLGDIKKFFNKVEKILGTSKIHFNLNHVSMSEEMDKGEIGIIDYIHNLTQIEITEDQKEKILYLWNNEFRLNKELYNFIVWLNTKIKVGVLSNTDIDNCKSHREKYFNIAFNKDLIFLSAELGMAKPNEDIFKYAIEHSEVKPNEILFIDNCKENIDVANKLGIRTYLYTLNLVSNKNLFEYIKNCIK